MMLAAQLSSTLATAAIAVSVVIGLAGLAATLFAVAKVRGVEESVKLLNAANEGLRLANEDLRFELIRSERECAERVAKLEGQNQALLDGLGDKLASAIASRLESTLEVAARRIVDGIAKRSEERERRFGDPSSSPASDR